MICAPRETCPIDLPCTAIGMGVLVVFIAPAINALVPVKNKKDIFDYAMV
jgi:hypothetical protein